jgi:hypothetical protein
VSAVNKTNMFVTNLNPVKAGCLLIELLFSVSQKFHQLKVRADTLRSEITRLVRAYMAECTHE